MKKRNIYEISIVLFYLILPLIAVLIETFVFNNTNLKETAFKWFIFSAMGLRLLSAGIKQIVSPSFTLKDIFNVKDAAAEPLVREIGCSNFALAAIAVLSLFVPSFRVAAALTGGIYFLFAGALHLTNKKTTFKEWFAMLSNFFVVSVISVFLIINKGSIINVGVAK